MRAHIRPPMSNPVHHCLTIHCTPALCIPAVRHEGAPKEGPTHAAQAGVFITRGTACTLGPFGYAATCGQLACLSATHSQQRCRSSNSAWRNQRAACPQTAAQPLTTKHPPGCQRAHAAPAACPPRTAAQPSVTTTLLGASGDASRCSANACATSSAAPSGASASASGVRA